MRKQTCSEKIESISQSKSVYQLLYISIDPFQLIYISDSQPGVRKEFAGGTPNFKSSQIKPVQVYYFSKKMTKGLNQFKISSFLSFVSIKMISGICKGYQFYLGVRRGVKL